MATIPVKPTPDTPPAETVEERFRRLEAAWESDTMYLSDTTRIVNHPAFREIIGMGWSVVPLMLRELAERPSLWVWALPEITGENPVPPSARGKISKMGEAWLRRGKEHGYRCEKESKERSPGCGDRTTG